MENTKSAPVMYHGGDSKAYVELTFAPFDVKYPDGSLMTATTDRYELLAENFMTVRVRVFAQYGAKEAVDFPKTLVNKYFIPDARAGLVAQDYVTHAAWFNEWENAIS